MGVRGGEKIKFGQLEKPYFELLARRVAIKNLEKEVNMPNHIYEHVGRSLDERAAWLSKREPELSIKK